MSDLDGALARLAAQPLPQGLDSLEADVFARISATPSPQSGFGFAALAAVTAVTMGVAGASVPGEPARAATTLSPFGPNTPLAPSTLLAGVQ